MTEFEILHKDLMGRTGKLRTAHGNVETPTIMPVINPNLMSIKAEEMKRYGAEMLIANAYIIYRKEELREEAIKRGIHSFLGCEMPIMTDSGSYQLYEYRDVEVSNREILDFQQRIGSDVCVPLDIPTAPYEKREKAKEDLEETVRRLKEARSIIQGKMLAGVVQGSTFSDLREESAKRAAEIGFDMYAIGGAVPLLETYKFDTLVDIIISAKTNLPLNAPVHLFGAGHPMLFSLAVALGCDLFDSAAYALYARGKRYITSEGTIKVEDLRYLPCSCPVCSAYSINELKKSKDLLASHNLWATFEEMRVVKQSIAEGSLWELCERRCRAYPALLSGLKQMAKYSALIEKYDPITKRSFFYLGETSAGRPEVLRYSYRLNRFKLSGNVLITATATSKGKDVENEDYDHVFFVKPPFGPCPVELAESYPVGQSEIPAEIDNEAKTVALQNVLKLLKLYNGRAKFVFLYDSIWEGHPLIDEIEKHAEVRKKWLC
ncbi:tRNA guanosine(15) transglycosylase TgtA [Methanophagales archaeon]|nr:MAG: tRNA guanosine(15) transglycosylase TgtA [Methanophagales archaeon]